MTSLKICFVVLLLAFVSACGTINETTRYQIDPEDAEFLALVGYQIAEVLTGVQTAGLGRTLSLDQTNLLIDSRGGDLYLFRMTYGCPELNNSRMRLLIQGVLFRPPEILEIYDPDIDFNYSCTVHKIYRIEALEESP